MNYRNITIAGSGVLGSQIAFQTAFHGFNVSVYDISEEAIAKAKQRLTKLQGVYGDFFNDAARAEQAMQSFKFYTNLEEAVAGADLVIEAVPERMEIKQSFYKNLAQVARSKTVFATNSSTMVPSQFAQFTGRPDKFLALHFANSIWQNNTTEIMGHAETAPEYVEHVTEFARAIGMIPFVLKKNNQAIF